jgi:hypothetical protein
MGLFNSTVLDVAIGLIFVYLLLAILCTAANEWLAAVTEQRAKFLKKGLLQLLDGQPTKGDSSPNAFIAEFYKHPLVTGMMKDQKQPAYISARTFAAVVTDLLTVGSEIGPVTADIGKAAATMPDGEVKKVVVALAQHAERSETSAQDALEGWFNDAMDRVTGWYKRRTQLWTLIVATILVVVANADTVQIARRLWVDPVLRAAVVEGAKARSQNPPATISVGYKDDADATVGTVTRTDNQGSEISTQERQLLGQLLGWRGVVQNNTWKDWGERGLGWMLTVLALSMGAPFWFDLLNKFMNVRSAGKSPAESAKTPKK